MKSIFLAFALVFSINANSQIITTIAGCSLKPSYSGDGGPATAAHLDILYDVKLDKFGNIYICEPYIFRFRKINTAGIISTVAGTGAQGFSGDGGPATAAMIGGATGIAFDSIGNIFFADPINRRVRKIDTSGIISTVAGNGSSSYSGDGGPATAAAVNRPLYISIDSMQNIYITDQIVHRVRKINASGIISTIAGNGGGRVLRRWRSSNGGRTRPSLFCCSFRRRGIYSE